MGLTTVLFLLIFFGGLGLCISRGPIWGLYTYLAVFYLDPPSRWWSQSLPDLRWSLLSAFVTLGCILLRQTDTQRRPFASHGLVWIFSAYVLWMWLQTPFAISQEHISGAVLFTKYLILLYLIYAVVDTPDKIRDFLVAHVAGCFYLGWLAFNSEGGGRLEGVGGPGIDDANSMSMHFGTGLAVGAMLLMAVRGWRFWLVLGAMPFMLNGMVLGNSRGAMLGLAAGGLALFRLKPKAYRKQFWAFGVLGVLLLGYLAQDAFWNRLSTLEAVTSDNPEEDLDFSARSRLGIIAAQWQMFLDHPFGVGHAGTEALSQDYLSAEYLTVTYAADGTRIAVRSSHNTFMSVLVDQGVPGILLLAALLVWAWKSVRLTTRKNRDDLEAHAYATAVAGALVVAVVAGQFSPYLKAEVQIWCLGLLMSLVALKAARSVPAPSPVAAAANGGQASATVEAVPLLPAGHVEPKPRPKARPEREPEPERTPLPRSLRAKILMAKPPDPGVRSDS